MGIYRIRCFDYGLRNEINRRFDEQNKILEEQNVMLARLLELLEVEDELQVLYRYHKRL